MIKPKSTKKTGKLIDTFANLIENFANFSKADEMLTSTHAASNVDEDIAKSLKEREKLNKMIAFANKKSENSETRLKVLPDK